MALPPPPEVIQRIDGLLTSRLEDWLEAIQTLIASEPGLDKLRADLNLCAGQLAELRHDTLLSLIPWEPAYIQRQKIRDFVNKVWSRLKNRLPAKDSEFGSPPDRESLPEPKPIPVPPLWERIVFWSLASSVLAFICLLVFLDRPPRNPFYVGVIRAILSVCMGFWGALIPPMARMSEFHRATRLTKGLAQFVLGVIMFVVTFFGTPLLLPNQFPVPYSDRTVPIKSNESQLIKIRGTSLAPELQRKVDQAQVWKDWLNLAMSLGADPANRKTVVIESAFTRTYLPFRVRLYLKDTAMEGAPSLDHIAQLSAGLAFLTRPDGTIERQLPFEVRYDHMGEDRADNPNDNELIVEGADRSLTLLVIVWLKARKDQGEVFKATDFHDLKQPKITIETIFQLASNPAGRPSETAQPGGNGEGLAFRHPRLGHRLPARPPTDH